MSDKVDFVRRQCNGQIVSYALAVDAMHTDIDQGAIHAAFRMEWWDSFFLKIAKAALAEEILSSLADAEKKDETPIDRLIFLLSYIQNEVNNMALSPKRSTSITTNFAHICRLEAHADWARTLRELNLEAKP